MEQPAQLDITDILASSVNQDSITQVSQQFSTLFEQYWQQYALDDSVEIDIAPEGSVTVNWVLPHMFIQLDLNAETPQDSSINYVVYVDPATRDLSQATTNYQVYIHSPGGSWKYPVELISAEPYYEAALEAATEADYYPDTYFSLFVGILYESLSERYAIASQ